MYFTKAGFSWQRWSRKKDYQLFCFECAHYKVFFYVFFHGACKPCNNSVFTWTRLNNNEGSGPKTSGDETHKCHKKALLFITLFFYWPFLEYFIYVLLSEFCFRFLFVLTYFDSSWWHATGMQIVRTKITSLDLIFCSGNKPSSHSLTRFCSRKHK